MCRTQKHDLLLKKWRARKTIEKMHNQDLAELSMLHEKEKLYPMGFIFAFFVDYQVRRSFRKLWKEADALASGKDSSFGKSKEKGTDNNRKEIEEIHIFCGENCLFALEKLLGSAPRKDDRGKAIWYYEVIGDEGNTAGDPLCAAADAFESESDYSGCSRQVQSPDLRHIGLAGVFLG